MRQVRPGERFALISATLLLAVLTLVIPAVPAAASHGGTASQAGPPDPRFGAIETYDAPDAALQMGAGWTRIPFLWADMQPNGTHEWIPPISDEALAREISQGRQPVGLIITTPGWATDGGLGAGVPYGLHTGHNDPNNLWANFVRQLAGSYAGRIDHWIVWNEPDVWDASHPGYTWGGSVADFLQLQRVAYLVIKETNPNARVIFSGTSYWWDTAYGRDLYFRKYLDALIQDLSAPGNDYYCDAVALHVYFQPDFVYSITALYHQLMREHGFDKPIWIAETNAAPSLDPRMPVPNGQFAITLEEQAAYVIQAFAMGIAGGASRIAVFKTIDTPTDLAANPEPFGLVRVDGSRRPAFDTFRLASTYLAGFRYGQLDQRTEVSVVTVTREGGSTTVAWTRTREPATVQLPAQAPSATLVDMWGNRRFLPAKDGIYTLSLQGASCTHGPPCIIGGPPVLIVEGVVNTTPALAAQSTADADREVSASAPSPSPTPPPEYAVSLRPVEIKGARDVWYKRGLPGYEIELIAGPPFYLYVLTVLDGRVTAARRSLEPLDIGMEELEHIDVSPPLSTTMTTLYNRRDLGSLTVDGLFQRVTRYYQERPASPACDTAVTVHLNGEWAFPRLISESWAQDCEAPQDPSRVAVVGFATLTPAPTETEAITSATITPTLDKTPEPTSTGTPTASPRPTLAPTGTATSAPAQGGAQNSPSIWVILLTGAVVLGGALFYRHNGRTANWTAKE